MSDTSSPFQPPPFEERALPPGDEFEDELDLEDEADEDLDEVEDEDDDEEDLEDDDEEDLEDDDEEDLEDEVTADAGNTIDTTGAPGGAARAVLEHVARSIVDEPDAVVVEVGEGRSGLRLSLHVAPSDMGRIIGKRGRVAQAMRAVVRAAAAAEGTDASVDIVD